ncbi:MAG: hypothetical protein NC825_01320 [Candidatus Omnitrophica bacterium]|nr:hypothetical protein [Candidatus Omnitrophota bacterium]
MLCKYCNKNSANLLCIEISFNGKVSSTYCCIDCLKKNPEMSAIFESFVKEKLSKSKRKICPLCGLTLQEWRQSCFAGCAYCYKIFRQQIKKEIKKYHTGSFHRGKIPYGAGVKTDFTEDIEDKMRRAVMTSNIEEIKNIKRYLNKFIKNE